MSLISELGELLFDFRKEAKEAALRLEEADQSRGELAATVSRLSDEVTQLTDRLQELGSERDALQQENQALRKQIETLKAAKAPAGESGG